MTPLLVLLLVASVALALTLVRVGAKLRWMGPGPERSALQNALWSLAGGAALILWVASGVPPLSLPPVARWLTLGAAVGLIATGGVKSMRLASARQRELLTAGAAATTVVERVEVLEAQLTRYPKPSLRHLVGIIGGKVVIAGTALWAWLSIGGPTATSVYGTIAAAYIGWLGWDIFRGARRRAERERIEGEIEELLGPGTPTVPDSEGMERLPDGRD